MSILQVIIIVTAVLFILFGIDIYKRQKATILHFLVFFGGGSLLVAFALDNNFLNSFGAYFGLQRGADLIVYVSIILLFYFFIDLYNRLTKDKFHLTRLVSQTAIDTARFQHSKAILSYINKTSKDDYIFMLRAYNEQKMIATVIDDIIAAGFHKIAIIDDGSTDETPTVIKSKQSQYADKLIIHIRHTINRGDRGAGAATKTIYAFIQQYHSVLQIKRAVGFDADGQMDINDMPKFMQAVEQYKVDLYLGSRFIDGAKTSNMPKSRKLILYISKIITRIFYGIKASDPHNGYRVISISALKKIRITSDGMHYANELNEQIKHHRLNFIEVPVHIRYTDYSLQKGQKNNNSIKIAAEMIYKKLFFR